LRTEFIKGASPVLEHTEPPQLFFKNPLFTQVFMSAGYGVATEFFSYPLFVIWVMQHARALSLKEAALTIRREKNGFYHGFSAAVISAIPGSALYVYGKHFAEKRFGDDYFGCMMQGLCAQGSSMIACEPASKIMEGLQSHKATANTKITVQQYCKEVMKKEGVLGFYRGILPGFLSYFILDTFAFYFQARLIALYPKEDQKKFTAQLLTYMTGFALSSIIVAPIDTIALHFRTGKTHLQYHPTASLQAGFFRGFYRGLPVSMLHSALISTFIPCVEAATGYVA
jgi:Mitochondrial carrier protein